MNTILLWTPGVGEIVVIALVVLLLFGGKKIPELMKGLGSGVREFNSAKNSIKNEIEDGMKEPKSEVKPSCIINKYFIFLPLFIYDVSYYITFFLSCSFTIVNILTVTA